MGKISTYDLVGVLVERRKIGRKEAAQFVNEMFNVIRQALEQDKLVKVKGLGTFKIIDVEDRESVDVNTGDRVLIEGHGKITFTPDALMKELVNKPFSQFETVVLKDGVDFDDWQKMEEQAEPEAEPVVMEPQVEDPIVEKPVAEEPVVEEPPIEEPSAEESLVEEPVVSAPEENPSEAPLVDFVMEEPVESSNLMEAESQVEPAMAEEPTVEEESEELVPEMSKFDEFKEMLRHHQKAIVGVVLGCAACFLIGYFAGNGSSEKPWMPETTYIEAKPESKVVKTKPSVQQSKPEPKPASAPAPVEEQQPAPAVEQRPAPTVEQQPAPAEDLDQYSKMDARVRTGAYAIVGTNTIYKVKTGDNLKKISRFFLGPDMECYIEVYNDINANTELKAGESIKIPKLVLKKSLKQNAKK